MVHGILTASYNIGDGDYLVKLAGHRLDSGEWCEVSLERLQNEFTLRMSSGSEHGEVTVAHGTYKEIKVDPSSVFLGSGKMEEPSFEGMMHNLNKAWLNTINATPPWVRFHTENLECIYICSLKLNSIY